MDELLVLETATRLIKDFELFNYTITYSGNHKDAYAELVGQIKIILDDVAKNDRPKMMRIFHKIDVEEKKININIKRYPQNTFSEVVAHLILAREFQKVLIHRHFSGRQ